MVRVVTRLISGMHGGGLIAIDYRSIWSAVTSLHYKIIIVFICHRALNKKKQ